jgi:putative protease
MAVRMEGDFNFNEAQLEDDNSLCRLRRRQRHPLADQVYLLEEASAPASSCPSWKTSTAPTS